jgi:hypothetical protein
MFTKLYNQNKYQNFIHNFINNECNFLYISTTNMHDGTRFILFIGIAKSGRCETLWLKNYSLIAVAQRQFKTKTAQLAAIDGVVRCYLET